MAARGVSWARFRVTVVCIVGVLILATLLYLMTGGTLFQEKATVYMYIPDATGLGPGLPVRVDGIVVGKVKTVQLSGLHDPKRIVKVTLAIERARLSSIAVDSIAALADDSLVGDKFVAITSGKKPEHIQPNGELTVKTAIDLVKDVNLSQFEDQMRAIDAVLSDLEEGRGRVGEFLESDNTYNDLRKRFAQLEQGMRAATSTTTIVGEALYSDQLYRDIGAPFVAFDKTLALIQSGQGTAAAFFAARRNTIRSAPRWPICIGPSRTFAPEST